MDWITIYSLDDGVSNSVYDFGLLNSGRLLRSMDDAWDAATEKWSLVIEGCKLGYAVSDGGGISCGLCWYLGTCAKCPVAQSDSGRAGCKGTPYWVYFKAARAAAVATGNERQKLLRKALNEAKKELAFLTKLRTKTGN